MKTFRPHSRVCNDGIGYIGKHPPDVAHTAAELLCATCAENNVAIPCIQATNKRPYARAPNVVDRNTSFLECTNQTLYLNISTEIPEAVIMIHTRCDKPRAPPPPRTNPIDLPQSLRANREKSLTIG